MTDQAKMQAMFGGAGIQGFFDFPTASLDEANTAELAILGVPIATSYPTVGAYCAEAPEAVRRAFGWPGVGNHYDFDIEDILQTDPGRAVDCGDLKCNDSEFESNRELIRSSVCTLLEGGTVPIILGGDDSVPIPVLQAFEGHGPITILQLDAHIDWRDEVQGEKFGLSSNMRRASEMSWVENIIQVGARGIGSARPTDRKDAMHWGVQFFPMKEVVASGLDGVIDAIPENCNLYIALDIDVMDPSIVPSVIGPAPGGMNYWDVVTLFDRAASKSNIVGANLVELMPERDEGGRGALVAARIIATLCGLILRR